MLLTEGRTHAVHVGAAFELDNIRGRAAVRAGWESRNFLGGLRKLSFDVTPGLSLYPLKTDGESVHALPELERSLSNSSSRRSSTRAPPATCAANSTSIPCSIPTTRRATTSSDFAN